MSNSKTRCFHQSFHLEDLPKWGILPALHLALDEFLIFDRNLMVEKTLSEESTSRQIPIEEACKSLRMRHKHSREASCYTLCLSTNAELDKNIDLPNIVKERSLFELYWPAGHISRFFKKRNKLYHAFEGKYKSSPHMLPGGLTEWIYVTQGCLTVTLIIPTAMNRLRFENLYEGEQFVPEPGTVERRVLKENQFLAIPASFITIRETSRTTFALGGEMLHGDDISAQIEAFNQDLTRTNGTYCLEREAEIRHLYWFYAIHCLNKKPKLSELELANVESLRNHLCDWQHLRRNAERAPNALVSPNMFAPAGIQTSLILRDLRAISHRRSLKNSKNPVDISAIHTSVDD